MSTVRPIAVLTNNIRKSFHISILTTDTFHVFSPALENSQEIGADYVYVCVSF